MNFLQKISNFDQCSFFRSNVRVHVLTGLETFQQQFWQFRYNLIWRWEVGLGWTKGELQVSSSSRSRRILRWGQSEFVPTRKTEFYNRSPFDCHSWWKIQQTTGSIPIQKNLRSVVTFQIFLKPVRSIPDHMTLLKFVQVLLSLYP